MVIERQSSEHLHPSPIRIAITRKRTIPTIEFQSLKPMEVALRTSRKMRKQKNKKPGRTTRNMNQKAYNESTFSRLPQAIVLRIFDDVCLHPVRHAKTPANLATLWLSHVCRAWRVIVVSRPRLWTVIRAYRVFTAPSNSLRALVDHYCQKSAGLSLSIGLEDLRPQTPHAYVDEGMMGLLFRQLHRWRDITFNIPGMSLQALASFCGPAPILDSLTVRSELSSDAGRDANPFDRMMWRSLTTVEFADCPFQCVEDAWPQFQRIRRLILARVAFDDEDAHDPTAAMSAGRQLIEVDTLSMNPNKIRLAYVFSRISLPTLHHLDLSDDDGVIDPDDRFYVSFDLPLNAPGEPPRFFNLQRLTLSNMDIWEASLDAALCAFTELTSLVIREPADILTWTILRCIGAADVFPKLTHLEMVWDHAYHLDARTQPGSIVYWKDREAAYVEMCRIYEELVMNAVENRFGMGVLESVVVGSRRIYELEGGGADSVGQDTRTRIRTMQDLGRNISVR